jgi:hypothetical protein
MVPQDSGYEGNDNQTGLERVRQIELISLSELELEDALEPIDARQIVLILDACSSGQVHAQQGRPVASDSACKVLTIISKV